MTCCHCGFRIGEEEHRCGRCGRRPGDTLTGEFALCGTEGALAAQAQPVSSVRTPEQPKPPRTLDRVPNLRSAVQGALFPDKPASNVIAFDSATPGNGPQQPVAEVSHDSDWKISPRRIGCFPLGPGCSETSATGPQAIAPRPQHQQPTIVKPASKPYPRRPAATPESQTSLEFLPGAAARPRTLGTCVEASICCEAPVATILHRAVAAALDWSMVLIGWGLFVVAFYLQAGEFPLNKTNLVVSGGMLLLIAFTYGLLWALACTETPGQRWTHLSLITFDGFPPEPWQRLLRFAGSCLSACTLVGVLWCFADEETLGWQDHISSTFLTPRELQSQVFHRV